MIPRTQCKSILQPAPYTVCEAKVCNVAGTAPNLAAFLHCPLSPTLRLGRPCAAARARVILTLQKAHQLRQRLLIHIALEFDDSFCRYPVLVPTPGIELGFFGCAQTNIGVTAHQTQQKPDLLLTAVIAAPLAAYPAIRHLVAQPLARAPRIFTCCSRSPTSSCSSRYMATSGDSPGLMPPCGNCQECSRTRLPQKTSFFQLQRMMPTLGRYPSRSITITTPHYLQLR